MAARSSRDAPTSHPLAEQRAFLEESMSRYGKAVYTYAYRLTGSESDARDLAQEAFIRVFRAWRSFRPGSSFLAWIFRILTNLHRDELRKRKGRYLEELPDEQTRPRRGSNTTFSVTPIEEYHAQQLDAHLEEALAELSPEQRQVVVLADIEEYQYQEIAEIVGCSIGTVRSRLHRSRALLRQALQRRESTGMS